MNLARFIERAGDAAATVSRVAARDAVADALADYLESHDLPRQLALGDDLPVLRWETCPRLQAQARPLQPDGDVLVTGCLAAIAEEGAVVLAPSDPAAPFLAATHVVLVTREQVIATLDELWALLRQRFGTSRWPRAVNVVRGPSRTADLGVPSRLGAHGPVRLHIIVIEAD